MEQKLYDAAAKLPVTHAQLDISAVPLKQNNGVRRMVLTFAACAAAICLVLFSALFMAGQVRQYRDAVAYFEQYGLSTEGLTHKEIKDVYLDIITGSFSHPKTAGVLASKNPSEEILYCPAPMTKETYKRLFSTESDDWDPATFWSEDNQEGNVRRYYGTYNGLDVMPQKIPAQAIETYTIAGFDFICNACNIMVKKDGGAGVTLQAAYEKGLLTDKDIEAIYNYHKQTETALYEEFATNYTLPEYIPGSIKLAAKDAYTTWAPKDRQYRMSYYLIMGDFASVVRKSQPDAYNQWKSGINEAIMRGEWNDEMLLVSYIKHFNIPRASMEAALANYIYERTPEQLKMEFYEAPNLDIIYTFDNDIINNYYRYELAPTDSIPQSNLDPVTGLPTGVPEGFVLAPQDAGEIAPLDRKYRICYYNAMGAFSSLGSDRPEERDAILQEIWAEVKQGIYRDEMFLVSIIKGLNISREEFDRAYAKYMLQYDPEHMMTEYYEILNGDIIYTFDNEIINAYYRYEEPDWDVVVPQLSENKVHMKFDGQEYHYVDWHIGPDAYIYRDGYYMIWGEFLELANNRPGKSFDEWVKLRIAEADTAQTCNEAALVSFLKYFEIPKEDFETALAKFLSRHTPQELSWDYYWVLADADIIYTFDNEVINAYCRGEGSVVVPEPTDPTDPTDSTEPTDYPDLTEPTGPTSPTVPTEPYDPSEPTGPDITEPTEPGTVVTEYDQLIYSLGDEANGISIYMTRYTIDATSHEFEIEIDNRTDQDIMVMAWEFVINGKVSVDTTMACHVNANRKHRTVFYFEADMLEMQGIATIGSVDFPLMIENRSNSGFIAWWEFAHLTTEANGYIKPVENKGQLILDREGIMVFLQKATMTEQEKVALLYVENNTQKDLYFRFDNLIVNGQELYAVDADTYIRCGTYSIVPVSLTKAAEAGIKAVNSLSMKITAMRMNYNYMFDTILEAQVECSPNPTEP